MSYVGVVMWVEEEKESESVNYDDDSHDSHKSF